MMISEFFGSITSGYGLTCSKSGASVGMMLMQKNFATRINKEFRSLLKFRFFT